MYNNFCEAQAFFSGYIYMFFRSNGSMLHSLLNTQGRIDAAWEAASLDVPLHGHCMG